MFSTDDYGVDVILLRRVKVILIELRTRKETLISLHIIRTPIVFFVLFILVRYFFFCYLCECGMCEVVSEQCVCACLCVYVIDISLCTD